jgi:hypothetical protein
LSGISGLDEVGNSDRGQKANNGHYDHDFHQREAGTTYSFELHNSPFFWFGAA